jgi:hypothetical protein
VADIVPLPEAVLGEVMLGEELDVVEEETPECAACLDKYSKDGKDNGMFT